MRLREGEQVATLAPVVGSDDEPTTYRQTSRAYRATTPRRTALKTELRPRQRRSRAR